jgi:peptidoglycan/LPS O-acetylase OafA/YrhL
MGGVRENSAIGSTAAAAADRRIAALDGVRGLMTIAVVVSHFFGEVPNGIHALMFGWIAVDMFYVLSGFLIARLILDKGAHANFFKVFYIRRICRTFPIYFLCVFAIFWINSRFHTVTNAGGETFPLWAYATFIQNFWMAHTGGIGAHWLSPTWTLALEEQFYLLAPTAMLFTPRRHLVKMLVCIMLSAVAARYYVLEWSDFNSLAAHVLLPTNGDVLVAGVLGAVLLRQPSIPWPKLDMMLRIAPLAALLTAIVLKLATRDSYNLFYIVSPLLVSTGCACLLMSLVRGAPEAKRYESKFLGFFCYISYAVYLTHLMVLGLMHNLLLGTAPDVGTPAQIAVTIASIPVTVAVSWLVTRLVEEPITNFGRTFKWSAELRSGNHGRPQRNAVYAAE